MDEQEIPTGGPISNFHILIAEKFIGKLSNTKILKHENACLVLSRFNIPKHLHNPILKELEFFGIIKRIDKQNVEVILPRIKLLRETYNVIEKIHYEKKTQAKIADELGVSQQNVSSKLKENKKLDSDWIF